MRMDVSRETEERLSQYQELLLRWNSRINLVSPSSIPHVKSRHIDDCLQIAESIEPGEGVWVDLGSGGGLPGIVLAIAFASRPTHFVLLESDQRKATFLRSAIRGIGLTNTEVITSRIEAADPLNAAYLSARALAPLPYLMPYLDRHLAKNGQAWLMKGEKWQSEVDEARQHWQFQLESRPSKTQTGAAILKISEVSNA